MRPRFARDHRALAWAFLLFPLAPALSLLLSRNGGAPSPLPVVALTPLSFYAAYAGGVLSHNHNHCPTFRSRAMNAVYAGWLSAFYGFPIFAWVPTHNQNHHRYLNGKGDATRTGLVGTDTFPHALIYGLRAGIWQTPFIGQYLASLALKRSRALIRPVVEVVVMLGTHAGFLSLLLARLPVPYALACYVTTLGGPALVGPFLLQLTNYWQHVGCEPTSPDGHSRNFVSPFFNYLFFNNGYHTVHHEHPGTHWSRYPALHAARQAKIPSDLLQRTPFEFVYWRYFGSTRDSESITARPSALS
jgi:beta-carotene hydroxylase